MKIKMLTALAGADFALAPGDETDRFSTTEATRFVEAGIAVPVAEVVTERATKKQAPEPRG